MNRLIICILLLFPSYFAKNSWGQDTFDDFRNKMNASFDAFQKNANDEYDAFRKKINDEYAALLEKSWKEFNALAKIDIPDKNVKPIPPVVYPKDDEKKPQPTPKPLPYDDVVPAPVPEPQPKPVVPIEDVPKPVFIPEVAYSFFGTQVKVHFDVSQCVKLTNTNEYSVSHAWKAMSTENYKALIHDCLQIRKEKSLCDWAYLEMLKCMADKICGKGTNSATLLMAYVYCQSGYMMRLARSDNNTLYMMYASNHIICDKDYFTIDGVMFYTYGASPNHVYLCNVSFPQEKAMSLYIPTAQKFYSNTSQPKTRQSQRYPEVRTTMTSNKNLMDFYNTYPTSILGDNFVSRWAMYANTPMSDDIKRQIYPSLRSSIQGCNQLKAVNKLLNYVQTGFVYEYDDKVWGHDRAFFAEESLYYPYCDCEDRSILFTRIVRDLLGLNCILIYYPGHLASAVEFTEGVVNGDYIQLNGRKFIIADATYINAPVGKTMPNMDNKTAKVILLKK